MQVRSVALMWPTRKESVGLESKELMQMASEKPAWRVSGEPTRWAQRRWGSLDLLSRRDGRVESWWEEGQEEGAWSVIWRKESREKKC